MHDSSDLSQPLQELRMLLRSSTVIPYERQHILVAPVCLMCEIQARILAEFAYEVRKAMPRSEKFGFDNKLKAWYPQISARIFLTYWREGLFIRQVRKNRCEQRVQ
ncbi:hypothetical protein DF060_00365 [Burkholderia pseudomallei]|nr:hypothetical protein BOC47_11440 [Burkholderia pseudomallei]ARL79626.1 hypothetical protein BOC55_09990 [Burkholderia pseudomallei]RPE24214.1 hypothetical protein DF127_03220 [Burkholderia pseudomallei]RPE25934.1 hypothetical protein DF068_00370 [Burkholderia pseudomallei]RQT00106.1 hypothetical protein DF125_00370 [Burkholderia pseudomallei]